MSRLCGGRVSRSWPRHYRLGDAARADALKRGVAEARARTAPSVGVTGVTLSGYADRVDLLPAGMADILDYKTGSSPSKAQAHTLLAPQLALEGALLRRGAFKDIGRSIQPTLPLCASSRMARSWRNRSWIHRNSRVPPKILSEEAWARLEQLLRHYADPATGYLSRALPFREGETDGDYDHLARVLEWSAGGDDERRKRSMKKLPPIPDETAAPPGVAPPIPAIPPGCRPMPGRARRMCCRSASSGCCCGGTDPSKILCLTYTRAAAANMSNRVFPDAVELDDASTTQSLAQRIERPGRPLPRR